VTGLFMADLDNPRFLSRLGRRSLRVKVRGTVGLPRWRPGFSAAERAC